MLDRMAVGELPRKHHVALRAPNGALRYEHCLTRDGFDGAYSILYRERRPQALEAIALPAHVPDRISLAAEADTSALRRRHFRTSAVAAGTGWLASRMPLLCNRDVTLSESKPSQEDALYFENADADELFFVR